MTPNPFAQLMRDMPRPYEAPRRPRNHNNPWNLTPRQQEVMDAVCEVDGSSEDIARRLGVTVGGFEQHALHIYRRMGVRCRARAAVLWALWKQGRQD